MKIDSPFLTNMDISVESPHIRGTTIDLRLKGGIPQWIDGKDILLDFFQSASIRDLFCEINKKINARK